MKKEQPKLNTNAVQIPVVEYRYKQFITEESLEVPSSHELTFIQQELKRTVEHNSQRIAVLKENSQVLQKCS